MTQTRINVRSIANTRAARNEVRNGRQVIIVPSATLPDDIVMNRIKYPADEIERSFMTLDRTPAPLGHPMVGNMYVSARDPEGINVGYVGAWNENPRRKDGRVLVDKVIDVEFANRCEGGKRLLEAIKSGTPIHTSTGLLANLEKAEGDGFDYVAHDLFFDHDAILLDEEGAATPEQGVGMLVNGKTLEVVNSSLEDQLDEQLDWALDNIARNMEQRQRLPLIQKLKSAILEFLSSSGEKPRVQENADMADEKKVADLENRMGAIEKAVTDAVAGFPSIVANAIAEAMKPVTEQVNVIANAQKKQEADEKALLVNKIVEAGILSKESAETLTNAALAELAGKVKPGKAAGLNPVFNGSQKDDEFAGYDMNALIDEGKK